jgi:DNA primase
LAYISEESILEVKNAIDIVEVVSGFLPLKRKSGSYWAPCPFHDEKTASFHVVPEKQFYKCFGCGAHGGVIDFVVKFEKIDFPAAVELLAEKAGITLRYTGGTAAGPRREDLVRTNEWAAGVFRKLLLTSAEAESARKFLERRGVAPETSEAWRLGYAPEGWDGLLQRARRNGISEKLLMASGLAVEREDGSGFYDRFRGRVMFPIFDIRGKVIAFGGRTLKDETPKFINSPETALFSKGRQLFGLHAAKDDVEESRTLHIVEGYLDVIVPWQAGVKGIVATLGTALTRDHLKLLKRYVDRVVLVFDSDAAGQKAAERGLDLLLAEDMDLFVAKLPPGEDTDDVVLKEGADALRKVLDRPQEVFAFLVASLTAKTDTTTPAGKSRVVDQLLERIATVPNPVKQAFLVKEIVAKFGVDERALWSRLRREEPPRKPAAPPKKASPARAKLGRELLSLFLNDPECAARLRREVPPDRYPDEATVLIARKAYELHERAGAVHGSDLLALVRDEGALEALTEAMEIRFNPSGVAKQLEQCLGYLKSEEFRRIEPGALRGEDLLAAKRDAPDLRRLPKPAARP